LISFLELMFLRKQWPNRSHKLSRTTPGRCSPCPCWQHYG